MYFSSSFVFLHGVIEDVTTLSRNCCEMALARCELFLTLSWSRAYHETRRYTIAQHAIDRTLRFGADDPLYTKYFGSNPPM